MALPAGSAGTGAGGMYPQSVEPHGPLGTVRYGKWFCQPLQGVG